jgi:hypothetical protein
MTDPSETNALQVRLERPSWLARGARLVIHKQHEHGMSGEARLGTRTVASLAWASDGQLWHARQLDAAGRGHGLETEHDDGRLSWCAQWVRGKQHGLAMQFDDRGRPLVVTQFVRGRGTDIWTNCGEVTEVHEMNDGRLHGFVRWGDPRQPWEEEHFHAGKRHGIFRRWSDGKLRKGFPQFYVNDKQVSRRAYEAAQARDRSLPPYDQHEDSNRRSMPAVVDEAIARARVLRSELALLAQIATYAVQRDDVPPEVRPKRTPRARPPRRAATARKPKKR